MIVIHEPHLIQQKMTIFWISIQNFLKVWNFICGFVAENCGQSGENPPKSILLFHILTKKLLSQIRLLYHLKLQKSWPWGWQFILWVLPIMFKDEKEIFFLNSPRHIVLNDHLSREPPPPQKKRPFLGGGMFFWDKFVNFCPFCIKKILERLGDWADLTATYRPIPGRFQSRIKIWNFKNMRFLLFLSKFLTFFFQMSECWAK